MGRTKRSTGILARTDVRGITHYRGTAYVHGKQEKGPWTTSEEAAHEWRAVMLREARAGTLVGERLTVREAIVGFSAGIANGTIVNQSGRRFKPSVVRDYKRDLARVEKYLGARKLDEVRLPMVNTVAGLLRAQGLSDSTVRNTLAGAFRSMYSRWALPLGLATINPCVGLNLPITDEVKRERIATVEQCALLLAALELPDRTAFALACYAGLRGGEVFALDWSHVDLDRGLVTVERGWDPTEGAFIAPKTEAAYRDVPIRGTLRMVLEDHAAQFGAEGLLFSVRRKSASGQEHPMSYSAFSRRLKKRWAAVGLEPLGMHEARHTFASVLIDVMVAKRGGVNLKALTYYLGHASTAMTYDRYGHLFPGNESEVRELLDAYDLEALR